MTRRRRGLGCFSCGALLSETRSFCDEECERYAAAHGHGRHGPQRERGFPESNCVRKDLRWAK
jgi:hypothetical protein